MIDRMSHTSIWVHDQDEALKFYTEKLGFNVKTDITMEGFRWLTVSPPAQDDLEIVLMKPTPGPMMDAETVETLSRLMNSGAMGAGVLHTDDCRKTYEELKEKGVEFVAPPAERPYGIEAIMKDNSGNWFSLTQPKPMEW